MISSEETPDLTKTLEALRMEIRMLRYLFSISIIVLSLVLMFIAPVVISTWYMSSANSPVAPFMPEDKREYQSGNAMIKASTPTLVSTTTITVITASTSTSTAGR